MCQGEELKSTASYKPLISGATEPTTAGGREALEGDGGLSFLHIPSSWLCEQPVAQLPFTLLPMADQHT